MAFMPFCRIYGVHAVLPIMRRQRRGHFVNTASMAGLVPFPYRSLYCTWPAPRFPDCGFRVHLRGEL
jgi:NADP-dependent 3-hydroxy acid dehydrogenase YdfG